MEKTAVVVLFGDVSTRKTTKRPCVITGEMATETALFESKTLSDCMRSLRLARSQSVQLGPCKHVVMCWDAQSSWGV